MIQLSSMRILIIARIPILCLLIGPLLGSTILPSNRVNSEKNTYLPQENHDIRLIFTGNTRGYIDPCDCSAGLLGGLDKRSAAIEDVLDRSRPTVLFDLGNLFERPFDNQVTDLGRFQARFLSDEIVKMGYVFMALGNEDLSFDAKFLAENLPQLPYPPLLTNISTNITIGINTVPQIRLELGELTLDFFNVVDPALVAKPGLVSPWRETLRESLYQSEHSDEPADLQIVIAHVPWETAKKMSDEFPTIDVFINGIMILPMQGMRTGNSIGMTVAGNGQMISVLDLTSRLLPDQQSGQSAIIGFQGRHIALSPSSDSNPEVFERMNVFKRKLRQNNLIPPRLK